MWVKRELNFALMEERYENHILPLLVEDCDFKDLSWTLRLFQMIDFRQNPAGACKGLLRSWKRDLKDDLLAGVGDFP